MQGLATREPAFYTDNDAALAPRPVYEAAKRAFDIAFALALLLVSLPVWLLVAALIRLTSPGPVVYHHTRCGKNGVTFECYKFRTMVTDADQLLMHNPQLSRDFEGMWKLDHDPRITWVGKWLRKTSLDELPQIFNVLHGEMSVVGPRPVQPKELLEHFGHSAAMVTAVKPGLTSFWTISGRSLLTYAERVLLEIDYVQRRGFAVDLFILILTIPAVVTGRGAR